MEKRSAYPDKPFTEAPFSASTNGHKKTFIRNHIYHGAKGKPVLKVEIWKTPDSDSKQASQYVPNGEGGWQPAKDGEASKIWCLYRLHLLKGSPDAPVILTEGEKDAERMAAYGYLATTSPGGAKNWQDRFADDLKGHELVTIIPDNDEDGERYLGIFAQRPVKGD